MKQNRQHGRRARRRQAPYAVMFAAAIVLLLTGAVSTFRVIGASALRAIAADSAAANTAWPGDSADIGRPNAPVAPRRAEYDRFEAEDRAWRDRNARAMSLEELRVRGDGRRTPREAMEDRVFRLQRAGRRERAIDELERWVRGRPRDQDAVLTLARLLREAGRTDDALRRYREVLALSATPAGR
jgi:tetratricopeptide (TPR) repeat protein